MPQDLCRAVIMREKGFCSMAVVQNACPQTFLAKISMPSPSNGRLEQPSSQTWTGETYPAATGALPSAAGVYVLRLVSQCRISPHGWCIEADTPA